MIERIIHQENIIIITYYEEKLTGKANNNLRKSKYFNIGFNKFDLINKERTLESSTREFTRLHILSIF